MNATDLGRTEADFTRALLEANQTRTSWRERLQWIRDQLVDAAFPPGPGSLAVVAIYLRFLATGELACAEDGRHFRPNHHAEAALQIETALERLSTPETAWILRRIYSYLPSGNDEFRRSEPLTRIRDIAHRNDIPSELKKEIKQRLQNKLHRCAGPEDLHTSAEILQRITAPGASYAAGFVEQFQIFHGELQEFFNATALETRLQALARSVDPATAKALNAFLELKAAKHLTDAQGLALLEQLSALRRLLAGMMSQEKSQRRSGLRLADIGLEDYAFTLLSARANRLTDLSRPGAWADFLRALLAALENLRLSLIEPEECEALHAELSAWAQEFSGQDRFHLLRLLASLARTRRLAESYTDRINRLLPPRVEELGRALGIMEHALEVFTEGDIRGHVVFQFSRLVDQGLQSVRRALQLPPWEAIVPGEATGKLVHAQAFSAVEGKTGPLLVLLEEVDGDAEIPSSVKGIALGHLLPHLSHLGVRARQARVPFAASADREQLRNFEHLVGKYVQLCVTPEGLSLQEAAPVGPASRAGPVAGEVRLGSPDLPAEEPTGSCVVPEAILTRELRVLPLDQATAATCGPKAAGTQRLLELAAQAGGLFQAPRGLVLPFGALEHTLEESPAVRREYLALQESLQDTPLEALETPLQRLRELVQALPIPDEIGSAVAAFFGPNARLAVRSSANGEDLEHLAGAGLYESVLNVRPAAIAAAITQVWASVWTRRATVSRVQAGIPHSRIHMAVLVQEMLTPELSFILHTVNPLTSNPKEVLVELAVGLGEILASACIAGAPYRMGCARDTGITQVLACANFSVALRPASDNSVSGLVQECLDYSRVPLSADPRAAQGLGKRLAAIAVFLEDGLGQPQDVEGVCVGEEVYIVQARPQQGLE